MSTSYFHYFDHKTDCFYRMGFAEFNNYIFHRIGMPYTLSLARDTIHGFNSWILRPRDSINKTKIDIRDGNIFLTEEGKEMVGITQTEFQDFLIGTFSSDERQYLQKTQMKNKFFDHETPTNILLMLRLGMYVNLNINILGTEMDEYELSHYFQDRASYGMKVDRLQKSEWSHKIYAPNTTGVNHPIYIKYSNKQFFAGGKEISLKQVVANFIYMTELKNIAENMDLYLDPTTPKATLRKMRDGSFVRNAFIIGEQKLNKTTFESYLKKRADYTFFMSDFRPYENSCNIALYIPNSPVPSQIVVTPGKLGEDETLIVRSEGMSEWKECSLLDVILMLTHEKYHARIRENGEKILDTETAVQEINELKGITFVQKGKIANTENKDWKFTNQPANN